MIESLGVHNFRCFQNLSLHGLRRFNLIVGENGSGKTALLEAPFIAGGRSPEICIRTRAWRGTGEFTFSAERGAAERLLRDMFHNFDLDTVVEIGFIDSEKGHRSMKVFAGARQLVTLPLEVEGVDSSAGRELQFEWTTPSGVYSSKIEVTEKGFKMEGFADPFPMIFLSGPTIGHPAQNAERFSLLDQKNSAGPVKNAVRAAFPDVQDLSLQLDMGVSSVFASVKGIKEKIPVGLFSAGVNKFLAILLAVVAQPKGTVLIDEVENGFYFKMLPEMWASIVELTKRTDSQIFATTHSLEFLKALEPSIRKNVEDYCLIRTERKNGRCGAAVFSGGQLKSAIEQNLDVR